MSSVPPDRVVIALASIASGAATGSAAVTVGLIALRSSPGGDTGLLLVTAVFLGVVGAAITGWALARRIDDTWRRGVTAALATFGACILAGLAVPADMIGGRGALVAYCISLVGIALYSGVRARRAERGETGSGKREAGRSP